MSKDYSNDYCYRVTSSSQYYPTPLNFISDSDPLPNEIRFVSLYAVTKTTADALQRTGTIKGFKGDVWSPTLAIDIDDKEKGLIVAERIKQMGFEHEVFDSGGRSIHIEIMRNAKPSHLLPAQDKQWVKDNVPEADLTIYTSLHLFRILGAVHEKTGKPKEFLYSKKGKVLVLSPLREIVINASQSGNYDNNVTSIFDCWRVMINSVPAAPGRRHEQLVRLAYALKDDACVSLDTAIFWMGETNKMFSEPKTQEEIEYIAKSIYG